MADNQLLAILIMLGGVLFLLIFIALTLHKIYKVIDERISAD